MLNNTLKNCALFLSLEDILVTSLLVNLSLGKSNCTLCIVYLDNDEVNLIANAYDVAGLLCRIVCKVIECNIACVLCSEVYDSFCIVYSNNCALNFLSCMYFFE